MKKIIYVSLAVLMSASVLMSADPYYNRTIVWCPSVSQSTSTFYVADNKYIQSIELINLTTTYVTFVVKASSGVVEYKPVSPVSTENIGVNEKWEAVNVSISQTYQTKSNAFSVDGSSVNLIGVVYRWR